MNLSKLTKRHLIRIVFLVPFILCLVTSIGIKSFLDNQAYKRPEATEYNLTNIVNYRLSTLYMPEDLEGYIPEGEELQGYLPEDIEIKHSEENYIMGKLKKSGLNNYQKVYIMQHRF